MSDFLEKVGLYMVGKVGWPVLLWAGSRVAGPLLSGGPVGPVRGIFVEHGCHWDHYRGCCET